MGIPKFFRWLGERYPLCSQQIDYKSIPEFDNLYLDMNGIIHNATHANAGPENLPSENQMFLDIFAYIERVFNIISPQKMFFMAVDGIAPRSKMNQQRARRFKTAQEATKLRDKMVQQGKPLDEKPFDSNCITPGTVFMTKLSHQLKYFIHKKISEDEKWKNVTVVLSGHETPGEGEHKIMEYIRLARSQPDYDPNTRHCIYGLDADLIMLGLVTHEPHTSLLREVQTFGRKSRTNADRVNFHLLHLSLLREYMDLEFSAMKDKMKLKYDLERLIDDFILICMFIGNDFIPHLPEFHIHEGALDYALTAYKVWLLTAEADYLHENGKLNMKSMESFLRTLDPYESHRILSINDNDSLKKSYNKKKSNILSNQMVMTISQKGMYQKAKSLLTDPTLKSVVISNQDLPEDDLDFIENMVQSLRLNIPSRTEKSDGSVQYSLELTSDQEDFLNERLERDTDASDSEAEMAIKRVLKKYDQAKITQTNSKDELDQADISKHHGFKKDYYYEKMKIDIAKSEELKPLVSSYIRGIQWVLYYYYRGIQSWGWYYPYHYAPMLTDLVDLSDFSMEFEMGAPFLPFEQLMGVLPKYSADLVPPAFRVLMDNPMSSINDFYSTDFSTDRNGKLNDWEFVILIPFIDQKRLVTALKEQEHLLNEEERQRNQSRDPTVYRYDPYKSITFPSSLPGFLPPITNCQCLSSIFKLPELSSGQDFKFGLLPGVNLGEDSLAGFPSLHTLKFSSILTRHSILVFQQESKRESMVVTLEASQLGKLNAPQLAQQFLGKSIYVDWPYLKEAKVLKVADKSTIYTLNNGQVTQEAHTTKSISQWENFVQRKESSLDKTLGLIIGPIEILIYVAPLIGMMLHPDGSIIKHFDTLEEPHPAQIVLPSVKYQDPRYIESPPCPMSKDFPVKTRAFMLGEPYYGAAAQVVASNDQSVDLKLLVIQEPKFDSSKLGKPSDQYLESYNVARRLNLSSLVLSKITSSLHVILPDGKIDIGLDLKFEGKKQKVIGYTLKTDKGWCYSQNAINLIKEYITKFPEIIQTLNNRTTSEMLKPTDLYPENVAYTKIDEIREWLKLANCHNFKKASIETDVMTESVVSEIAAFWDAKLSGPSLPYTVVQVPKVPRPALLKPSLAQHTIKNQKFSLGDRVVYIKDNGAVPIGSRGTVVGKNPSEVDILFDKGFIGGTDLGGLCPAFRGYTLPSNSLLNLTAPQFNLRCQNTPQGPIYTAVNGPGSLPKLSQSFVQKSYRGPMNSLNNQSTNHRYS